MFSEPKFVKNYLGALANAAIADPESEQYFWSALEEIADLNGWVGHFSMDDFKDRVSISKNRT